MKIYKRLNGRMGEWENGGKRSYFSSPIFPSSYGSIITQTEGLTRVIKLFANIKPKKMKYSPILPFSHSLIQSLAFTALPVLLIFVAFIEASPAQTIKPQPITVGMFNVYSRNDGNLGEPTPDLREVWEGVPSSWKGGSYPYEACNIIQHYWPRTGDLPDVPLGIEPYTAWWKDYLQQVYDLGSEKDGKVRLRAIVGPLYAPFEALGADWLKKFIKELVTWEMSGSQLGVIAGWYIDEEPMGASHRHDPDVLDQMVKMIKETEREAGSREHKMYLSEAVEGRFFTEPGTFIRFTRNVDVFMISTSSYIWLTQGQQPVYEEQWKSIPFSLYHARNLIYQDRDLRGERRPEIHVILEAGFDPERLRHGQPTAWEMRQQIRLALGQGYLLKADNTFFEKPIPPADGIWFFWWPGLAKDPSNRSFEIWRQRGFVLPDNWLNGRGVVEAIESELAFIFNQSEVKPISLPAKSRFVFSEIGSFNPVDSSIPYELSESGTVRIDILNQSGLLIENFNMGVQAAGMLHRFGGPYWKRTSSNPNGRYTFRLYLNSILRDSVTMEVQWSPLVSSPSHQVGVWSKSNRITVAWKPEAHLFVPLDGYSYEWDTSPFTDPPTFRRLDAAMTQLTSDPLPDGKEIYFHIRSVDAEGRWSETSHLGPFYVDTQPPKPISQITAIEGERRKAKGEGIDNFRPSPFALRLFQEGDWLSDNSMGISWQPAEDELSGVAGYAVWLTNSPVGALLAAPSEAQQAAPLQSSLVYFPPNNLSDGIWYFHVRSQDNVGNWSQAQTYAVKIDSTPPPVPNIFSSTHPQDKWVNNNQIKLLWTASDLSGINGYNYLLNREPVSDLVPIVKEAATSLSVTAPDDGLWYFQIMAQNGSGLWSQVANYRIQVDTKTPSILKIASLTHPEGKWTAENNVDLIWETATGSSGVLGYSFQLDRNPDSLPDDQFDSELNRKSHARLADGIWYFHLKALSRSGIWGNTAHYQVKIDTQPPLVLISFPQSSIWYKKPIQIYEGEATDETSGVDGLSFEYRYGSLQWKSFRNDILDFDRLPQSDIKNQLWQDSDEIPHPLETSGLTFQVRLKDLAGNLGLSPPVVLKVDSLISKPLILSDTHPDQNLWSSNSKPNFIWKIDDVISGLEGFSFILDQSPDTQPPESKTLNSEVRSKAISEGLADGIWYFHIGAVDKAGNWSDAGHYRVKIDTMPPEVKIKLFLPQALEGGVKTEWESGRVGEWEIKYLPSDLDVPIVRSGLVTLELEISEELPKDDAPRLRYKPNGRPAIPINLTREGGEQRAEGEYWQGEFRVDIRSGDGLAKFEFSAIDKAGNVGASTSEGGAFLIDTLIRKDAKETIYLFSADLETKDRGGEGANEQGGKKKSFSPTLPLSHSPTQSFIPPFAFRPLWLVAIPPGSLDKDLRMELKTLKPEDLLPQRIPFQQLGIPLAAYKFEVYDADLNSMRTFTFRKPISLFLKYDEALLKYQGGIPSVYYWDGAVYQRLGGQVEGEEGGYINVRVENTGVFAIYASARMDRALLRGWAAPNPFTPNNSGDESDRTMFHVVTRDATVAFTIKIYDLNGRLIRTLPQSSRIWDGADERGRVVEAGIYIYQVRSGKEIISGTVVLVK